MLLLVLVFIQFTEIQAQTPEERLEELGITLTEPGDPVANFVNWRRVGNVLYLSGSGARVLGKLGDDLTDPKIFRQWQEIFDRVHRGEMPPESETRPGEAQLAKALESLETN